MSGALEWVEKEIVLAGAPTHIRTIAAGTKIIAITILANGWSWETLVDTVAIYE